MLGETTAAAAARWVAAFSRSGYSMIRRSSSILPMLLGAAFAAILLTGCAPATTSPTATRRATPVTTAPGSLAQSASASAAASASASASAAASDPLGLPHFDKALEATMPAFIGNVQMAKFSLQLLAYMSSNPGAGENSLYTPWLVKFGRTPSEVPIAIATDLRPNGLNFVIHAIRVQGYTATALASGFADVAAKAGWPVKSISIVKEKATLEIIDPAARAAGSLYAGYVYAKDDVLYTVISDDPTLILEALIKLP
jgi:hypothetical protein